VTEFTPRDLEYKKSSVSIPDSGDESVKYGHLKIEDNISRKANEGVIFVIIIIIIIIIFFRVSH
jgi:hypothetical protein